MLNKKGQGALVYLLIIGGVIIIAIIVIFIIVYPNNSCYLSLYGRYIQSIFLINFISNNM